VGTWEFRIESLCNAARQLSAHYYPVQVVLEYPEFMQSQGGMTAARRGDLVKLCVGAGMLASAFNRGGTQVRWVPVHQWKGQMPKSVTQARVKDVMKRLDPEFLQKWEVKESHVYDAIGLGLYSYGYAE
jgi:hypothetical protein